jgi:hypothetical protein
MGHPVFNSTIKITQDIAASNFQGLNILKGDIQLE